MKERDDKLGGSGCAIGCLLMLLISPVLYVLSMGPMFLLAERSSHAEWFGVIYYPVEVACRYCGPFDKSVEWYMSLWTTWYMG
jgi:hypothetical protein